MSDVDPSVVPPIVVGRYVKAWLMSENAMPAVIAPSTVVAPTVTTITRNVGPKK